MSNADNFSNTNSNIIALPTDAIRIPNRTIINKLYLFVNCAENNDPKTNPIGGNKFEIPYVALLMCNVFIAMKGATAANT